MSVPDSVGNLTSLTTLAAFDNRIPALPEEVDWPNLVRLNLHKNVLTCLPESLGDNGNTCLTFVDLSSNLLTELPESIVELTGITSLYLADNQLVRLPDAFGELIALSQLTLNRNRLTVMPASVDNLTDLVKLNVGGNPLEPLDDMKLYEYGDKILRFLDVQGKYAAVAGDVVPEDKRPAELTDAVRKTVIVGRRDGAAPSEGDLQLCVEYFTLNGCRLGDRCQFSHTAPPPLLIPEQYQKEDRATERAEKPAFPYYGEEYDE